MGEARKLQKKLRRIEHLEIDISQSLTPEERVKVFRKAELRTRLAELLLQLSGPQQTPGIVGEGKHEEMKKCKEREGGRDRGLAQECEGERKGSGATNRPCCLCLADVVFTSLKASWEKAKFRLRTMEGHSDIITCVVAVDNLVRDCVPVPTATEQQNLGGHTCGVSCLSAPPPEYCRRLVFPSLHPGQCVKSIYTFNVAMATSSLDQVCVDAVSVGVGCVCSQGPLMFSSTAEGGVYVWEGLCTNRDPLQLLHPWDAMVTGCGSQGGPLTLRPCGDRLSVAYGTVSRLTNHSSFAGETDCADGERTLNLFSLPQCRYLASLTCADAPGIVCFATWLTGSGGHRWVTGGCALAVWEHLPSSGKGDVTTKRDNPLDASLTESEGDSEEDSDGEGGVTSG
uniref:Uncharacterized protein n=1 Tax=Oncorhynchus mykiss TaxID=8022 RepID=A0A8C7ND42_ONCMY